MHICSGYVTQVSDPWPMGLLFIRFACLEGHISSILNSVCINLYITYHKNDFFLRVPFYALSNGVNKFCDVMSSTLIARRDSVVKEYFLLGIINYISRRNY